MKNLINPPVYISRVMRVLCAVTMLCLAVSAAQAQKKFSSADEAVTALVAAVRADNVRDMIVILGDGGREIMLSGDDVADQKVRATFLVAYDVRHQIVQKGTSAAELVIGANDWPFPIPLVQKDGSWQFDTGAGREEILYRRIGRNELAAIQVCLAYVDAQNEYASMNPLKTKVESYAQRIVSSPGQKDGLYWPAAANEPQSPLGEAAALATLQGYRFGGAPQPYHGYYYKVLTGQGPTAPGGAVNYVVNGNMIGGFALVAWPAQYGSSGVMTFLVNHTGTIFQKDLGARTERVASRMTLYAPDATWKRVPDADLAAQK